MIYKRFYFRLKNNLSLYKTINSYGHYSHQTLYPKNIAGEAN